MRHPLDNTVLNLASVAPKAIMKKKHLSSSSVFPVTRQDFSQAEGMEGTL